MIVLLSGRNTVASCLGWQTTLHVVSMLVLYLVCGPTAPLLRRLPKLTLRLPMGLRFTPVLVGWKKGKHAQLSFFVSRKSALLIGLLQPCVWMTDPLYRILMTCAVFFRPFTRPCLLVKLPLLLYEIFVGQCLLYYPSNSGRPLDPDECFVAWMLHMNLLSELLKTAFRSMAGFTPSGGSKSKDILLFVIVVVT